jgi:hydrogenase expression/formation protein HypC
MCLALPARVVAVADAARHRVLVEVGAERRQVSAAPLLTRGEALERLIGEWVLLHQGFAMQRISPGEAAAVIEALKVLADPRQALDVTEFDRRQQPTN